METSPLFAYLSLREENLEGVASTRQKGHVPPVEAGPGSDQSGVFCSTHTHMPTHTCTHTLPHTHAPVLTWKQRPALLEGDG